MSIWAWCFIIFHGRVELGNLSVLAFRNFVVCVILEIYKIRQEVSFLIKYDPSM